MVKSMKRQSQRSAWQVKPTLHAVCALFSRRMFCISALLNLLATGTIVILLMASLAVTFMEVVMCGSTVLPVPGPSAVSHNSTVTASPCPPSPELLPWRTCPFAEGTRSNPTLLPTFKSRATRLIDYANRNLN